MREAKYLNNARMMLGTNCAISGTGFMISSKIVQKYGGWKFHLLTEDIEFSVVNALEGERIGYCGTAVLYDEQPTTFQQSWAQRRRWSKGFYQVMWKYGRALASRLIHNKNHPFACYDMLMTIAPASLLSLGCMVLNAIFPADGHLPAALHEHAGCAGGQNAAVLLCQLLHYPFCNGSADHHHRVEEDQGPGLQ